MDDPVIAILPFSQTFRFPPATAVGGVSQTNDIVDVGFVPAHSPPPVRVIVKK
jgi:hypothetical protein